MAGDKKEYNRYIRDADQVNERPTLLIEYNDFTLIEPHVRSLIKHISDMDIFDVYIDSNPKINVMKPTVSIIDKTDVKMLKRNPIAQIEDHDLDNFYYRRFEADEIWFGNGMV